MQGTGNREQGIKNRVKTFLLAIGLLIAAGCMQCQTNYNATIGPLVAYTNQATAAPSAQLRNIGQCAQWLYYQVGGTTSGLQIAIEGASDPVNGPWTQISTIGTSLTTGMVSAATWMPFLRANIYSLTGAAPSVSAQYYGSTQCSTGQGGLAGGAVPSQPVTFVSATSITNTATNSTPISINSTGVPTIIFGGTVYNPNASVVYLVITATSPVSATSPYVLGIPGNSTGTIHMPTIGLNIPVGSGATRAFCTSSLSVPADPGTACQVTIIYKTGVLVNGNVSTSGTQQGGQQQGNPISP